MGVTPPGGGLLSRFFKAKEIGVEQGTFVRAAGRKDESEFGVKQKSPAEWPGTGIFLLSPFYRMGQGMYAKYLRGVSG
jgi:hypothetical protein